MEKKNFILRLDEQLYEALARWAADDFRSINGQVEWIIHNALKENERLPKPKVKKAKSSPDN
ncbi:Arc family DNA binding domain-containing protein [Taibaiella lutea]|uniref:Arc family DNA binding domain-containing protein n=1 Tax=Taibaiella lutea TaxID=2608001 RepID=A0A5M6CJA5_9BACT|nr:Arc family DNA binding domain-containing protein [Taibaiella lutea]KAA5533179.1 Arc family DNA binding domain-containing protein [Taibaiella lutea]